MPLPLFPTEPTVPAAPAGAAAPAFPDARLASRANRWLTLSLSVGFYLALVAVLTWGAAAARGPGRGPGPGLARQVVAVALVVPELPEMSVRPAQTAPRALGLPALRPGVPDPGGSFGSHTPAAAQAPELANLAPRMTGGDLAELAPAALAPPGRTALLVAAPGLPGAGLGTGKGTGIGAGVGPGQGVKGGGRMADLARFAATARPIDPVDFVVTRREVPHYKVKDTDPPELYGSVVVVRLVVGAEGVPLYQEVVSGPAVLHAVMLNAAKNWRFALSARVKAQAPVLLWIRFKTNPKA